MTSRYQEILMKSPTKLLMLTLWLTCWSGVSALGNFNTMPSGLNYRDLQIGQGQEIGYNDVAVMHFVGWMAEDGQRGREFFNSRSRGEPVSFVVGTDKVMQGWNEGVVGMRAGGRRLLLVPPGLAYGNKGVQGVIPENASLLFLIELLEVEKR